MRKPRAKPINVSALLEDMDRLIEFNRLNNKDCKRIMLTAEQYVAFLKKNNNQPYYRKTLIVSQ